MKIIGGITTILATASAFTPCSHTATFTRNTAVYNSRVDSSEAVKAALEASKTHGPTSPEARVAWDIVEEMDASDNSNAYSGGESTKRISANAKEYTEKVAELAALLEEQRAKVERVKSLAQEIQAVKISKPSSSPSADSPALREALAAAKSASEEHGSDSKEAALAWEAVEEIASSDSSEAMKGTLDDECLVETIDACEALAELERAINVVSTKGERYSG
mmetsp:Transcript_14205/g.20948  ORF Transcript_14205/g.20948 Transcript_14205/m.20948 type:complete len:221 (+) Transcript_14205:135-797(+)